MGPSRRILSLKEKVEIIRSLNGKRFPIRELAEKWKIGRTQAAEILKNKEQLLNLFQSGMNENAIRIHKGGRSELIDKVVLEWLNRARSKNVPLSGALVREKAMEIARHLNIDNFKASNGWLDKFKTRHKIEFKSVSGESSGANEFAGWCSKIAEIIGSYEPVNIFNVDETGLFYRALPNKTSSLKEEACAEGEMAKERLTVMLCASMCGEKVKPLVVGKASKPRCFKNVDVTKFGVDWKVNEKAWMTSSLMTEWLEELNQQMKLQQRKILLFLDNATSHVRTDFDNIRLVFIPPNISPTSQPLAQGVIQDFKTQYRQLVLQHLFTILAHDESANAQSLAKGIDVLKAMTWIEKSWNDVTTTTITNCFKKVGFLDHSVTVKVEEDSAESLALNELLKMFPGPTNEDYVRIDENLSTECSSEDIADILAAVNPQNHAVKQEAEDEELAENHPEDEGLVKIENYSSALVELKRLQQFYLNNGDQTGFKLINDLIVHHERELSFSVMNKTADDHAVFQFRLNELFNL